MATFKRVLTIRYSNGSGVEYGYRGPSKAAFLRQCATLRAHGVPFTVEDDVRLSSYKLAR